MVSPTEILPYFQLASQSALVIAAGFAAYQFLLLRRQREENNALNVLTRLQTAEFRHAYTRVWELPLDASPDAVRKEGHEMEEAVEIVAMTFESLGVMVHNRIVDLETVDQVIGGFLRESWRRTHRYVLAKRKEVGSRRYAEWYQWLAEHLAVETRRSRGAYDVFRKWKP